MHRSPDLLYGFYLLYMLVVAVVLLVPKWRNVRPGWFRRWQTALLAAGATAVVSAWAVRRTDLIFLIFAGPWGAALFASLVTWLECRRRLRWGPVEEIRVTPAGLGIVHEHLRWRSRQISAAVWLGHVTGMAAGCLEPSRRWILPLFPFLALPYSFLVLERFGQAGGLLALHSIDPLPFRSRFWKEYGLVVSVLLFTASIIGFTAAILWMIA